MIVLNSRTDLGVHEIADAIAERSLSFRKVKVQGVAFPLVRMPLLRLISAKLRPRWLQEIGDGEGRTGDRTCLDVLIVGAGISGIDAAYRLKTRCTDKSWLILEARDRIGGTWDLFRYPGVRSDSDIFTLGFPFRPVAFGQGDRWR